MVVVLNVFLAAFVGHSYVDTLYMAVPRAAFATLASAASSARSRLRHTGALVRGHAGLGLYPSTLRRPACGEHLASDDPQGREALHHGDRTGHQPARDASNRRDAVNRLLLPSWEEIQEMPMIEQAFWQEVIYERDQEVESQEAALTTALATEDSLVLAETFARTDVSMRRAARSNETVASPGDKFVPPEGIAVSVLAPASTGGRPLVVLSRTDDEAHQLPSTNRSSPQLTAGVASTVAGQGGTVTEAADLDDEAGERDAWGELLR